MVLLGAIVLLAGFWQVTSELCARLPRSRGAGVRRWLRVWTIKGLAVPFLIWLVFNEGFSERFPPLMPQIQAAAPGRETIQAFLQVVGIGLFVIASYWATATLGWLLAVLSDQVRDRGEFKQLMLGWSAVLLPLAAVIIHFFGWSCAGLAGVIWLLPLVQQTIPLAFPPKTAPLYSRAITKMHGDHYKEAELAVLEELEKAEDDFRGWMMLAELYATHFNDLAGAARIIRDTCAQPATTPSEICVALHRLADWHLKLADNPDAARAALEEIRRLYPRTHMDRMAQLRIRSLPASREELIERRTPRAIPLPALRRGLGDDAARAAPVNQNTAAARARECARRLAQNPDNAAVREDLARVLAEGLGKVDLALEQLELLLGMPDAPAAKAAEWLSLMAAWQIAYKGDAPAARDILERIIRNYPRSSQAFAARGRLRLMDLEVKIRAARSGAGAAASGAPSAPSLSF